MLFLGANLGILPILKAVKRPEEHVNCNGEAWTLQFAGIILCYQTIFNGTTINFRTTISLPRPPRCIIVTHKVYTYAGLFIRWILIGRATGQLSH
jgi:hypothetical protein